MGSGGDAGVGRAGGLPRGGHAVRPVRRVLPRGGLVGAGLPDRGEAGVPRRRQEGRAPLLEPIMKVEVITPEESMGDVIGDLNSRRGMIQSMGDRAGNLKVVTASVPLAEMFNYVSKLRGMTKGRANYTMKLDRYEPVPPNIQEQIAKERSAAA